LRILIKRCTDVGFVPDGCIHGKRRTEIEYVHQVIVVERDLRVRAEVRSDPLPFQRFFEVEDHLGISTGKSEEIGSGLEQYAKRGLGRP